MKKSFASPMALLCFFTFSLATADEVILETKNPLVAEATTTPSATPGAPVTYYGNPPTFVPAPGTNLLKIKKKHKAPAVKAKPTPVTGTSAAH